MKLAWIKADLLGHRSLLAGSGLSLLIQVQLVVVQLVTTILLARFLGPNDFGIYAFFYAIIMLVQVFPGGGFVNVIVRFVASYTAHRQWSKLNGLLRFALGGTVICGGAIAVVAILLGLSGLFSAAGAFSPWVLALAGFPLFFLLLLESLGAAVRALHPGVRGQLPHYLVRPLVFLIFLCAFVLVKNALALTPGLAILGQGAAMLVAVAFGMFWFLRTYPVEARKTVPEYEGGRWSGVVMRLALLGGVMIINRQTDILMLGSMTTAQETGLYKVAVQGVNLVALPLTAAGLFIGPRIARIYAEGALEKLQRLLTLTTRAAFALAVCAAIVFWAAGYWLLEVFFGVAYRDAYGPLAVLCVAQLINVAAGLVNVTLNMTGHERDALFAAGAGAVINIGLNLLLIPLLGGIGAALSTTIATLVWNAAMMQSVWRRTGLVTSVFRLGASLRPS